MHVHFDIDESKIYSRTYGYNSNYTEEYQQNQQNLISILQHAYFDLETKEEREDKKAEAKENGEAVKQNGDDSLAPEFIVITIADIVKGIEIETTMYFDDFKKALSPGNDYSI